MKIVTDVNGNKYTVEDTALTPYVGGPQKRAKVLKSFRTEEGANTYLTAMKGRLGEAFVIKSLDGYDEYCDPVGVPLPALPTQPVHIIVEEDLGIVGDSVVSKNGDDMFAQMYRKGLVQVEHGSVMPSQKFYELLSEFTENAVSTYMKSSNPEADKTDTGVPMIDVITEAYEVLKSSESGKLALSQEEASNTDAPARTESLGDQKGRVEAPQDGKSGGASTTAPEGQALSQEEADAKNAGERLTPISDEEIKQKTGDVQVMKSSYVFKSLVEAQAFSRKNPEFAIIEPSTIKEKNEHGKRFTFAVRKATVHARK